MVNSLTISEDGNGPPFASNHEPDEKGLDPTGTVLSLPASSESNERDPDAEARALRKVDRSVLFLLFLGMLLFQLDRMNLASALTDGFAEDVGVSQDDVNLSNQLMYMGIVVLEIPCNMALQRLGPRKWMSAQVLIFGIVSIFQMFISNRGGFLAARLMLGFAEAGYIPGAMYTLSTWYTRPELAKRIAVLFFGMFGGNAVSPLLSSGILKMGSIGGLHGWQWLFMLEGIATVLVSFLFFLLLPGSLDTPKPLLGPGIVRFTHADQHALMARLEKGDHVGRQRDVHGVHIDLRLVWRAVSNWRRWPHYVASFLVFSTWSPLTTYTPSVMVSLGFDRTKANALASVGGFLTLPVVFAFAAVSDRFNRRGATVITAQACYLVTLVVARQLHPHVGKWSRWGLWTAVNAFAVGYHPSHNTWLQLNGGEAGERSISIVCWVMFSNLGMLAGSNYFRAEDKPFYQTGLRNMIILVASGMVCAAIQVLVYILHNRRVAQGKHRPRNGTKPMIFTP